MRREARPQGSGVSRRIGIVLATAAAGALALVIATGSSSAAREPAPGTPADPNGPEPVFGLFPHEASSAAAARLAEDRNRIIARLGPAMGGSTLAADRTTLAPSGQTAGTKTDNVSGSVAAQALALDPLVSVGTFPAGVAATNAKAYVANAQSNSVSVIDIPTATVTATVPVGTFPVGVALSPDSSQAYVANYNSNSLSIIDTASNTVVSTVAVGSRPNGVIRVGATVYVANLTGNSISVVNPATATVTSTVTLGSNPSPIAPSGLAANGAGTRLYASDAKNGKVVVLDLTVSPPTVISNSTVVGTFPAYVAVAGTTGYVANAGSNNVSVLNLSVSPPTVTATVPVGTADYGIAAQPSLGQVFVTNSGSNNLMVINAATNAVGATFSTGVSPNAIALTPNGLTAVVSNQGDNTVSIFPVDQRPVNTVPGAQSVNANGTGSANKRTFSAANSNLISVADSDAGSNPVKVTLSVSHGILTLSGTTGLSFSIGANGTAAMTFTGTLTDVNTALAGTQYTPTTAYVGADTLTITTDDQGNTGIGLVQSDTDTVSINVVNVAPVVGAVSFTGAVGNTIFGVGQTPAQPETHAAGTVLSSSTDANNDTLAVTAGNITSANGAAVVMSANGTFTYITAAGGATGNDTFTFTVTDGHGGSTNGTATVTVANRAWYVNNALASNGSGLSTAPFNTLANLRGAGDADSTGDYIFLYQGSGNYTGGLPLENNQLLIGQPQGLVINAVTIVTAGGSNPTITNSSGVGIVLAQGNTIRRVNVANTSSAGINGSGINTADIGPNMTISGAGGAGFSIFGGGNGDVTMAASVTHSNASGRSVFVGGRTGGTVTISGSVSDTAGGVQTDTNTGATINFTGGLTISGNTETFKATGGGTVSVTGTNTLSSTVGSALNVTGTSIGASGLTFQSISSNGATNGIILNGTGSTGGLTVTGTGAAGSGGTIQNASGDGISLTNVGAAVSLTNMATTTVAGTDVLVNGGAANLTYAGTITNAAGRSVNVLNKTGGTVLFSGAVNDTGTGISLTTNTGATVNFTGGLTMSTGSNAAFAATGGGTVTVTGSNNTIATTTGTALNVANTTIGATGLTFKSINAGTAASGPVNGILLSNTGSGGLTVAGDGSANSGGTIQKTSGDAISLTSASNISLTRVRVINNLGSGINGTAITNFNIDNSTIDTTGDDAATDEAGIRFTDLAGTSTWTNIVVAHGFEDNARILNTTAALTQLTVTGSTFRDTPTVSPGNNGLLLQAGLNAGDNGSITADITTSSFLRNRANGLQVVTNSAGSVNVEVGTGAASSGGTFTDNNIGVNIAHNSSGTLPFKVNNASFSTPGVTGAASPINLNLGGAATGSGFQGTVSNNTITNNNSLTGPGIRIIGNGAGTMTVQVNNNNISAVAAQGIQVLARDGSNTINATILSNTINLTNAGSLDGIRVDSGATGTDTTSICADIRLNNSTAIAGQFGARVRQRFAGTHFTLEGYGGSATNDSAVATFLNTNNTLSPGASADHVVTGFTTTANCPTPS